MTSYNLGELRELMRSLYMFSGIRFVLFDTNFKKILSYPESDCDFCTLLKKSKKAAEKCRRNDRRIFRKCAENGRLMTYTCHAGLVESTTALKSDGNVVGYLMFGQIAKAQGSADELYDYASQYVSDKNALRKSIAKTVRKTEAEILSAAKIMEVCANYIFLKELIYVEAEKLFEDATTYIDTHISENIGTADLCNAVGVGRTKLYSVFAKACGTGVAEYIRKRKLHFAKKLIKTTKEPIGNIAMQMGFADYNYFAKIFKKTYGASPKYFRTNKS